MDVDGHQLIGSPEKVKLTEKETQILAILIDHAGELVSRDYFVENIWQKEGVVTVRSLDMYISRLRKKMKNMTDVQIANQHGKGYYLKMVKA